MLYTALLKLHILLIAVPGLYGGLGGDALHHPLTVHVAYLTQQSRAYSVGVRSGSVHQSSFCNHHPDNASPDIHSEIVINTATLHPATPAMVTSDFAEVIGSTLSPRAP